MAKQRLHAEIAGGGIGGLVTAAALAQRGWSVRVHERSPNIRAIGAGIYMFANGLRVLGAIGALVDAVRDAHAGVAFDIRDRQNRTTELIPFGIGPDELVYTPTRQQLLDAIHSAALRAGVEVVTGSEAVSATPEGELLLQNGRTHRADLVVAADGVNSKVRDSLGLMNVRMPLEDGGIRLMIPRTEEERYDPELQHYIEHWCGARRILYTPCDQQNLYLFLGGLLTDPETRTVPVNKDLWIKTFPHLGPVLARIGNEGRWDPFEIIKLSSWSRGRVAVLGDAAHAQPPNLGQGGGCALMNGIGLAVALSNARSTGDIVPALQAWEKRERPLTEHTQKWTYLYGELGNWPDEIRSNAFLASGRNPWLSAQRLKTAHHVPSGTEHVDLMALLGRTSGAPSLTASSTAMPTAGT